MLLYGYAINYNENMRVMSKLNTLHRIKRIQRQVIFKLFYLKTTVLCRSFRMTKVSLFGIMQERLFLHSCPMNDSRFDIY